ncbi:MAG TPA: 2-oxoglutarate oxidoreductase, partial [Oscillospiraceae bacterium]|nr:2-oxoglutarate oxidoreductase [Oscillospiraceae bacterium]
FRLRDAELGSPAGIAQAKAYLKKAFEKQINGEGFCLVELLSPCPTNLNLPPVKAAERVRGEMTQYFPTGEFRKGELVK